MNRHRSRCPAHAGIGLAVGLQSGFARNSRRTPRPSSASTTAFHFRLPTLKSTGSQATGRISWLTSSTTGRPTNLTPISTSSDTAVSGTQAKSAVFVVSNFLSNPAKDYLEAYQRNNHPPFTIKVWERTNIESMTRGKRDFLQMHGLLRKYVRPESEIWKAEKEFWDRVWYYRHMIWMEIVKDGRDNTPPDIIKMAKAAAAKKRKEYGSSIGKYMSDFEWGICRGSSRPCVGYLAMNGTFSIHKELMRRPRPDHARCPKCGKDSGYIKKVVR
jgi:hypothetical protein